MKKNKQERKTKEQQELGFDDAINSEINAVMQHYNLFKTLPENTPQDIVHKEKQFKKYEQSVERIRLKQLADAQVAQFFIPKTNATKNYLLTDAEYRGFLRNGSKGLGALQSSKLAYAESTIEPQKRFFHWFLEYPEVFAAGGFDCILGNPPYLGGSKISTNYSQQFSNYLLCTFICSKGMADLVSYFFKRDFQLLKSNAYFSLITTDSISQGATRESSLDYLEENGSFNFALKSIKWPGIAAVNISMITFFKGKWKGICFLNNEKVSYINSLLDSGKEIGNPFSLIFNKEIIYTGSKVYGEGFVLEKEKATNLLQKRYENKAVIFPYLTGDDLANSVEIKAIRYVINFQNWDESHCSKNYPECFEIVENLVKPEREKINGDDNAKKKWWLYQRIRKELYDKIINNDRVLVLAQTAKYLLPEFVENKWIYSVKIIVFTNETFALFALIHSTLHNEWVWKYSTTMGSSTIQYSTSQCFENFPLPQNLSLQQEQQLENIGAAYHEHRRQLMLGLQLGLTKTYNLFHDAMVSSEMVSGEVVNGEWRLANGKKMSKNVEALIKHLQKTPNTISIEQSIQGIVKLRELHIAMDNAVLDAYGWNDLALKHNFYEVDYLPENDRVRFTIHPDTRKEVLKRLLELNHSIHQQEVAAGLWDKKTSKKKKIEDVADTDLGGLFTQE